MPDEMKCARCEQKRAALGYAPLPTELGQKIATEVCQPCWSEWLQTQTRIINHYGLDLTNPEAQGFLIDNMKGFFYGASSDLARKITLPARLAAAIEEKLGAEQESQRMQFVLAREKQEADRRRIEAQGIADFQHIVSQGINEQLLKWKGIEATQKLAESQNTKVVIVGSGKDGLPVILGGQ
jgi:Fe-S cluster biosynthesis and repair protein YggX